MSAPPHGKLEQPREAKSINIEKKSDPKLAKSVNKTKAAESSQTETKTQAKSETVDTKPAQSSNSTEEQSDSAEERPTGKKISTSSHSSNKILSGSSIVMSNTLANIRSCVAEFDTEQTTDVQNMSRRFSSWLENFEAVCEFEEVTIQKQKPALLAVGGSKLRELVKTLGATAADGYPEVKDILLNHFKVKKNTTAERFKFLNTRPESAEETHDHWVTRLRRKVLDCEFDKLDDNEAIKLVILLHTHNEKLQREILAKDLNYAKTIELARSLELTDREMQNLKQNSPGKNRKGCDIILPGNFFAFF